MDKMSFPEAQDSPDHVDVSTDALMTKHRVLRHAAEARGAGGEGDITP